MMDLIDRKAVLEALDELDSHQTMSRYLYRKDLANVRLGISMAVDTVEALQTVDAVEVVRCKECLSDQRCKFAQYQGMNGYCSLGERICDECVECDHYWANSDSEFECQGQVKPCHEFIPKRGL